MGHPNPIYAQQPYIYLNEIKGVHNSPNMYYVLQIPYPITLYLSSPLITPCFVDSEPLTKLLELS